MINPNAYITIKNLLEFNISLKLGLTTKTVQKDTVFLEAGQHCHYFYYIVKGFVRVYYIGLDGNEITHWFSAKDTMITSPFSFFKHEENIVYFEALEDTELLLINTTQLDKIMSQSQYAEKAYRNLLAEFAMVLSRRIMSIHNETAERRYLNLMQSHPLIFQKAKLSHIASYLGVTPQSLSRIRKNI